MPCEEEEDEVNLLNLCHGEKTKDEIQRFHKTSWSPAFSSSGTFCLLFYSFRNCSSEKVWCFRNYSSEKVWCSCDYSSEKVWCFCDYSSEKVWCFRDYSSEKVWYLMIVRQKKCIFAASTYWVHSYNSAVNGWNISLWRTGFILNEHQKKISLWKEEYTKNSSNGRIRRTGNH